MCLDFLVTCVFAILLVLVCVCDILPAVWVLLKCSNAA